MGAQRWGESQRDRDQLDRWITREPPDVECPVCYPLGCDDPDGHMGHDVPSDLTPLRNRGCRCGADFHGGDCMCFEGDF